MFLFCPLFSRPLQVVLVFPTLQEELALSAQEQRAEKEKQAKHKARDPVKREFTITIKIMLLLFRVLLLFESFGSSLCVF